MQAFRKSLLVTLVLTALLAACAPAQPSQEQVQSLVQTSVASTMQAQNQVSTFVAQTVQAQQPAATQATTDTPIAAFTASPFPTLTPVGLLIPTSTSEPSYSAGSGGYVAPAAYSCDPDIDKRPLDGSVYYVGEHFEVKWTLLNNGTQQWCNSNSCPSAGGPDLAFFSSVNNVNHLSTNFLSTSGPIQVPALKPGDLFVVPTISAVAPNVRGTYTLTWKLQGGFCYPYIHVIIK